MNVRVRLVGFSVLKKWKWEIEKLWWTWKSSLEAMDDGRNLHGGIGVEEMILWWCVGDGMVCEGKFLGG